MDLFENILASIGDQQTVEEVSGKLASIGGKRGPLTMRGRDIARSRSTRVDGSGEVTCAWSVRAGPVVLLVAHENAQHHGRVRERQISHSAR